MKIGIIVAMQDELACVEGMLESKSSVVAESGSQFIIGDAGRHEIILTQSGIGKVNAAVRTFELIDKYHPDIVINSGVAGGIDKETRIMDMVVGTDVVYHDVWCGPGTEWGDAAGCPRFFESVKELTALPCLQGNEKIKHGLICSGDIFISKAEEVERIRSLYTDVLAVDMESASIAQVCYLKNVMFFCMRVISDTPGGDDNIAQYENFWEDAPRHTFDALTQVISSI